MRLAIINSVYKTGSTGKLVFLQNEFFLSRGFKSHVYYGRQRKEYDENATYFGNKLLTILAVIWTRLFDHPGPFSKISTDKLIRKLNDNDIDVVLLHNAHGYYLDLQSFFKWTIDANVRVFWILHDCWAFTGHCSYYSAIKCQKFQIECSNCPQKNSYPKSYVIDNSRKNFRVKKDLYDLMSHSLSIITVSEWLAKEVSLSILKNFPRYVIHNGIKESHIVFEHVTNDDRLCLLAVANIWEPRKGLNDILKVASMIDFTKIRMIVVGKVPKFARNQGNKEIEFIERTDSFNELCQLYRQSSVLLNLTHEDNFPTVNIEALMNGTPVITYDTGGSPEAITARTGRVVKKGDIDGVMLALNDILNCKYDISHECIERFKNKFTSTIMCERLEAIITQ